MKTYLIEIEGKNIYIKSDAEASGIQRAIDFTPKGEKYIERLLQAIRIQGAKATEIKLDPVEIFIVE
jgi:hypothetical protein